MLAHDSHLSNRFISESQSASQIEKINFTTPMEKIVLKYYNDVYCNDEECNNLDGDRMSYSSLKS